MGFAKYDVDNYRSVFDGMSGVFTGSACSLYFLVFGFFEDEKMLLVLRPIF